MLVVTVCLNVLCKHLQHRLAFILIVPSMMPNLFITYFFDIQIWMSTPMRSITSTLTTLVCTILWTTGHVYRGAGIEQTGCNCTVNVTEAAVPGLL